MLCIVHVLKDFDVHRCYVCCYFTCTVQVNAQIRRDRSMDWSPFPLYPSHFFRIQMHNYQCLYGQLEIAISRFVEVKFENILPL